MQETLTLYTNPQSRGRIARWMLEEVGAPYHSEILDYGAPLKTAAYRALNPLGKVPTLVAGTVVITETAAICAYLADAYPAAALAPPPQDPLRGPYYRWLFFAAGPLEAALTHATLGVVVPPEQASMVGYGRSLAAVLDVLEAAVSGKQWLVGERFSAADVYVGAQLGFGMRFGTIERRPAFVEYWHRLRSRPAAQRAQAQDGPF
ncbi:MAG TPA: glutathione S-transferase family protein [Acidiferrobacteraceae bacterium]|nr:glutathione S-transferase family protein [Acidiferrobacteraceae bacterium]